jgi:hypothetical protein
VEAQYSKKAIILTDSTEKIGELKIPFADIRIIDARFDQTKIGYIYNTFLLNRISSDKSAAVFPDSLKRYLKVFLGKFLQTDPDSKDTLLILVKTFRISDFLQSTVDAYGVEIKLTLNFSASFFSNRNGLNHRLFSIDDVLMKYVDWIHEKKKVKHNEGTRADALVSMLYKLLQGKSWQLPNTTNPYTMAEIENAVYQRFQLPILTEPYRKGLYRSFSEFTGNKPFDSAIIYQYKNNKIVAVLNQQMQPVNLSDIWGLCDGNRVYINYNNEIAPMIRVDKGFEFLFKRKRVEIAGGSLANLLTYKAGDGGSVELYHTVNMNDGKVFTEEIYGLKSNKDKN